MRRGSIPLAFAIAGVLAALAFSVQFMTSNSARLEKTIELHEIAERLATAALEEVLTKMSNNMADTVIADNPGDKVFFRPLITRLLADKTLPGTQIPFVYTAGTYYQADFRPDFWSVRKAENALVIQCRDEAAYDEIIVEVEDPEATLAFIQGARPERT